MTLLETELSASLVHCQGELASALDALGEAQGIISRYDEREKSQKARLTAQVAQIAQLTQENFLLRQKVDLLARRVFGEKSEKISPEQMELLLSFTKEEGLAKTPAPTEAGSAPAALDEPPPAAPTARPRKPAKKRKPRSLEHLPTEKSVVDPQEVLADPEAWRCIGESTSEQLDYTPARYFRRVTVRRKYVRRDNPFQAPIVAPLPERLLDRSLPAPGLLAHIIVSKYSDHLPLYRQEQIARLRHGVDLSRQTMARWIQMAATWLILIYQTIKDSVLNEGYAQADETPIKYLEAGNGKTKTGYIWAFHAPGNGNSFFQWMTSRAAACLEEIIPLDTPPLTLGVDAYAAYPSFARQRPEGAITLSGCLSHARREFFEGKDQDPRVAGIILLQFQKLYAIESELRAAKANAEQRAARRQADSRPLLDRLRRIIDKLRTGKGAKRILPQSQLGKALSYVHNHWATFQEFLSDGRLEIDNNLVENAIRPTALGKKNWLFIGCAGAGQASAILFTIVVNCRTQGIDPWRYLRDVLTLLPDAKTSDIPALLPAAWAKSQADKTAQSAQSAQSASQKKAA